MFSHWLLSFSCLGQICEDAYLSGLNGNLHLVTVTRYSLDLDGIRAGS